MNAADIQEIILEQEAATRKKFAEERIVRREFPFPKLHADLATIITGPRRAGKSVFALLCAGQSNYARINFEDERLNMKTEDLNTVLDAFYSIKGQPEIMIFDEIQDVPGWEKFITRLVATNKVIITGSNSNLLSGELATHLTGRHLDYEIMPFSFREFLDFAGFDRAGFAATTKNISLLKGHLRRFLYRGGFPPAHEGSNFHQTLFSDIVRKDILRRHRPKYPRALSEMAMLMLSNPGGEVSFNKLKNILHIETIHTVKSYASYLEESYLVFRLDSYSRKPKERIISPKKYYPVDQGLSHSIGLNVSDGRLMESLVAAELRRRALFEPGTSISYWRSFPGHEVDFVVAKNGKPAELIQSCFDASNPLTLERELRPFPKASRELRTRNLTVITWEDGREIEYSGRKIRLIPLWKWLIEYSPDRGKMHKGRKSRK